MSRGPWNKPICRCGRCRPCKLREYAEAYRLRRNPQAQAELARIDAKIQEERAA